MWWNDFNSYVILFSMFSLAIIDLEGITGLSVETFKENWGADYQKTNENGMPQADGKVTWNFK